MQNHILDVVLADNPWLEGTSLAQWFSDHLPDPYLPRRLRLEPTTRACLVVGPRQAGKSTLIWKTLADLGRPALFLDCEEPAIREWLSSPALFLADVARLGERPAALFLEEVPRLPEAGLTIKGLVDRRPGLPIYATGSSSFDLEDESRESLAGRADRHLLLPLSLAEAVGPLPAAPALAERQLAELVGRLAVHGSYPAVLLASTPEREIAGLVEAFVIRDASDRLKVQRLPAFRKVLALAASQVGNLCNYSEWAALCSISNDTVDDYVHLLEETHVLRTVPPFVGGKRAEITRARKVFFLDNGLRNQLFGGFASLDGRADRGALLENLMFSEITKNINPLLDALHYWRSKSGAEVDFVLEHRGELLAVEVKSACRDGRPSRSAASFIDAYHPAVFVLVSKGSPGESSSGATRVRLVRPWEVAGVVQEFVS